MIPGGGEKYLPSVWVCVNMLRYVGCKLPIQVWHLGPGEMPDAMRERLARLGVECVDGLDVRKTHPARILTGWPLKPYAMLHCPFREVLLLDADNVAVRDPTFLFEAEPYKQAGAVFWPDCGRMGLDHAAWALTGVPYRDEPEFEAGQVLIDKSRSWRELLLTMWFNEHSDVWYRHLHGDKDTFHFAWRRLGTAAYLGFDRQRVLPRAYARVGVRAFARGMGLRSAIQHELVPFRSVGSPSAR